MTNYGKFTTVWDRIGNTYWDPDRIDYGWVDWKERIAEFIPFNNWYGKVVKDNTTEKLNRLKDKNK